MSKNGQAVKHLPRAIRTLEQKVRAHINAGRCEGRKARRPQVIDEAIAEVLAESAADSPERQELEQEFKLVPRSTGRLQFRDHQPYWTVREKKQRGQRRVALHQRQSLHLQRLHGVRQGLQRRRAAPDAADPRQPRHSLRQDWDFWQSLPTTPAEFIRIENLDEKIGALETLLLDKSNYLGMVGGDGACLGCGEKTVVHLFTATVEALMQPRVAKQVARSTT